MGCVKDGPSENVGRVKSFVSVCDAIAAAPSAPDGWT